MGGEGDRPKSEQKLVTVRESSEPMPRGHTPALALHMIRDPELRMTMIELGSGDTHR